MADLGTAEMLSLVISTYSSVSEAMARARRCPRTKLPLVPTPAEWSAMLAPAIVLAASLARLPVSSFTLSAAWFRDWLPGRFEVVLATVRRRRSCDGAERRAERRVEDSIERLSKGRDIVVVIAGKLVRGLKGT